LIDHPKSLGTENSYGKLCRQRGDKKLGEKLGRGDLVKGRCHLGPNELKWARLKSKNFYLRNLKRDISEFLGGVGVVPKRKSSRPGEGAIENSKKNQKK